MSYNNYGITSLKFNEHDKMDQNVTKSNQSKKDTFMVKYDMFPRLIIIGSTKGGTTTLINIIYQHLKSFYKPSIEYDLFYWTRCHPCQQKSVDIHWDNSKYSIYDVTYNWNVNISELCPTDSNIERCTITNYISIITKGANTNTTQTLYTAERTSGYMTSPFVAKLLAINFPSTILLYTIREKMTQIYSRNVRFLKDRRYHFNTTDKFVTTINKELQQFESNDFSNILMLISNKNQTDEIRNKIVYEYITYNKDKLFERNELMDICPYLNVLLYIQFLQMYNIKYGFSKLKLIQSEWIWQNITRGSIYIQCIVTIHESSSQNEFDKCVTYYQNNNNIDNILSVESQIKLNNNSYHKNPHYLYKRIENIELFDKICVYVTVCDMRLFELINEEKYKSLTVGTDWNYDRWKNKRKQIRQKLLI